MNNWLCITTLLLSALSVAYALNCYGPSTQLNLKEFDVFPTPVSPGEYIYARANLWPTSEISGATVTISVYYSSDSDVSSLQPIVKLTADLCTMSTMITCPVKANSSILIVELIIFISTP
jgi:hypothetical protein